MRLAGWLASTDTDEPVSHVKHERVNNKATTSDDEISLTYLPRDDDSSGRLLNHSAAFCEKFFRRSNVRWPSDVLSRASTNSVSLNLPLNRKRHN